jgi:excisionase family DNA binding protein
MSMSLKERTVLPPEDPSRLSRFARGLSAASAQTQARLIGPDGTEIEIPEEVYGLLVEVVTALSQGTAISIAPHNTLLTTQEAADMLNISRPTLVRLLTEGEIPYSLRGRHRRILLRDVVDYSERTRAERRRTLDQMTADAEEMDLYETTATPEQTR